MAIQTIQTKKLSTNFLHSIQNHSTQILHMLVLSMADMGGIGCMSSHRVGVDLKFCWGEISLNVVCAPAGFEITPHKMCMDEVSSVGCFKHVCHLDNCCFVVNVH